MMLNERKRNSTLLNLTQTYSEYRLIASKTRFSWLLATQSFVVIAKLCSTKPVSLWKKKVNRFGLVNSVTLRIKSTSKRRKFNSQMRWLISSRLHHKSSKLKRRKKSQDKKWKSQIKSQSYSVLTSVAQWIWIDDYKCASRLSLLK